MSHVVGRYDENSCVSTSPLALTGAPFSGYRWVMLTPRTALMKTSSLASANYQVMDVP